MGGHQTVVKTLHNSHGEDYKSIFMRLERTTEHIGYIPDHCSFFCDIYSYYLDFIVRHCVYLDSLSFYFYIYHYSNGAVRFIGLLSYSFRFDHFL